MELDNQNGRLPACQKACVKEEDNLLPWCAYVRAFMLSAFYCMAGLS